MVVCSRGIPTAMGWATPRAALWTASFPRTPSKDRCVGDLEEQLMGDVQRIWMLRNLSHPPCMGIKPAASKEKGFPPSPLLQKPNPTHLWDVFVEGDAELEVAERVQHGHDAGAAV